MTSTATATAQLFVALALGAAPTAGIAPSHQCRLEGEDGPHFASMPVGYARAAFPNTELQTELRTSVLLQEPVRETTPAEHAVGELRRWSLMPANWDGEGAAQPIPTSVREASAFAGLLPSTRTVEPMLHASGRAGLYLRTATLYADIEFLGDGRIAYYIESNGDKHKGVVGFDSKKMPPVFGALLET